MKIIRIAYTDNRQILAIGKPTQIASLLKNNERIVKNWYYNQPQELELFLKENPNKEDLILKAFSYWVLQKLMGFEENQNRYGRLKRDLKKFSEKLFKALRAIAGKIASDILKFLHPKKSKVIYT